MEMRLVWVDGGNVEVGVVVFIGGVSGGRGCDGQQEGQQERDAAEGHCGAAGSWSSIVVGRCRRPGADWTTFDKREPLLRWEKNAQRSARPAVKRVARADAADGCLVDTDPAGGGHSNGSWYSSSRMECLP